MANNVTPAPWDDERPDTSAGREETAVLASWLQADDPEALKALRALRDLDEMNALAVFGNLPRSEVDPDFRARLRSQLLAEADSMHSTGNTGRWAKVWTMLQTGFGVFGRRKR